jgi:hypothetical protein
MVTAGNGSTGPCWKLRDWFASVALFGASAAVALWQNAHVAVLWDISYVLDTASRIASGQVPYRDFPLVHAPLTFLIQAAILRLTGRVYFHHVLYVAVVAGLSAVLAWRILLRSLLPRVQIAWTISLLLTAPLIFLGIYGVFPFPSYDCDCACSILVAIYSLQRLSGSSSYWKAAATGASLCVPLFFKQNIGLPFLAVTIASILLVLVLALFRRSEPTASNPEIARLSTVLASAAATVAVALLLIHLTAGLGNYVHWTIQFAAQRRLPGFTDMLGVYRDPSLLWEFPCVVAGLALLRLRFAKWIQFFAIVLLSAPFLFTLCSLLIYDDADERGDALLALWPLLLTLAAALALYQLVRHRASLDVASILPIIVLVSINGTLMSQQLWGSTYAIWPLLILLAADLIAFLAPSGAARSFPRAAAPAIAVIFSVTLLVCGAFYTVSEERLSYVQLPDGPVHHSAFPQLAGMATPGPYLPDFDELLRYAQANIPAKNGIVLLPGEDPFYFATGRTPPFPVLLFDPATEPYSPAQLADEARERQIRWLIVKRQLQINADPTPERAATLAALLPGFALATHLRAYDIYRR